MVDCPRLSLEFLSVGADAVASWLSLSEVARSRITLNSTLFCERLRRPFFFSRRDQTASHPERAPSRTNHQPTRPFSTTITTCTRPRRNQHRPLLVPASAPASLTTPFYLHPVLLTYFARLAARDNHHGRRPTSTWMDGVCNHRQRTIHLFSFPS